ncbi:hypothetical protein KP509_01G050600 [Ceratopteris richardii]|nr:hypothetical protein KP509_01G050600 [Ceratopteris richardii]
MQAAQWSSEALQAMETHLCLLRKANTLPKMGEEVKRPELSETYIGPHLDLNSCLPLPYGWEQFLDLQSGQVYYIDWKNFRRSYVDPRIFVSEPEVSNDLDTECMSDVDNVYGSTCHDFERQVSSKYFTSPMLQEDWDLMERRGWIASDGGEESEITSEVTSQKRTRRQHHDLHVADTGISSSCQCGPDNG